MVLVSPHNPNVYLDVNTCRIDFTLEKYKHLIELCQILGAKSVKIVEIKIQERNSIKNIILGFKSPTYSGSLKGKEEELASIKDKLRMDTNFPGGMPDYQRAKKYLKSRNLLGDIFLESLLEMKSPENHANNPLNFLSKEICMTENLQKSFELIGKLKFPIGQFSANFSSISKEKTDIYIKTEITF
jgi:hypothetical protein